MGWVLGQALGAKQPSQDACTVIQGLQHTPHTLHVVITSPHAAVPFSWPQLCGVTHLQLAMQSTGDSEPLGSSTHWPIVALQLYIHTVHDRRGNGRRRRLLERSRYWATEDGE